MFRLRFGGLATIALDGKPLLDRLAFLIGLGERLRLPLHRGLDQQVGRVRLLEALGTLEGGKGFNFTGHHELMLPLLAAAVIDEIDK